MKRVVLAGFFLVLVTSLAQNAAADALRAGNAGNDPHARMGVPEAMFFRLPDIGNTTPFAGPVIDDPRPSVPDDHEFFVPIQVPHNPLDPRINTPLEPQVAPAAEPGTLVLLLAGLAGVAWTFGSEKFGNAS
jgi:hypothetical protein